VSQENLEIVRAAFDDFRALAGNSEFDGDVMLTMASREDRWDPDIELDCPEGLPDISGIYRGTEAVRQWWREWLAAWEVVQFEYELVDAGDSSDERKALIELVPHGAHRAPSAPGVRDSCATFGCLWVGF